MGPVQNWSRVSFRNKVEHDIYSIRKAELMASVAERIVDIILRACGNCLLNAFLKEVESMSHKPSDRF